MMKVFFKNLNHSELAQEIASEKLRPVVEKFPDLNKGRIQVTLERHNSPLQAGPDLFSVTFQVADGRYRGVRLTKSHSSLYIAVAELADRLLEKLNRYGDKQRVRDRAIARKRVIPKPEGVL